MSVDIELLEQYETDTLEQPRDSAFWDDRLFTTHGGFFAWAELSDDLVEESNYRSALSELEGVGEGDDVLDTTARHWLVGSVRQIFVRVRHEETGEYTKAFEKAVELAESLKDYGILDESDYSKREHDRFEENLKAAVEDAQREYEDDSEEEGEAIVELAREELGELSGHEGNGEVSWEDVAEIYARHRDTYFSGRAEEAYQSFRLLGVHKDQLEIPLGV